MEIEQPDPVGTEVKKGHEMGDDDKDAQGPVLAELGGLEEEEEDVSAAAGNPELEGGDGSDNNTGSEVGDNVAKETTAAEDFQALVEAEEDAGQEEALAGDRGDGGQYSPAAEDHKVVGQDDEEQDDVVDDQGARGLEIPEEAGLDVSAEQGGEGEEAGASSSAVAGEGGESKPPAEKKRRPRGDRSRKKKKEGPKRPLSAYTFFLVEVRSKVSTDSSAGEFKQVAQKVAKMWKELNDEDMQKYKKMAEDDKARYHREKAEYIERKKNAPPEPEPPKSRKKQKGSPKNPLSSYTFFLMEQRKKEEFNNLDFPTCARKIAGMWKELSEKDKEPYHLKAKEDRQRYEQEMIEWKALQHLEKVQAEMSSKSQKGKKRPGPKNPLSAYTFFLMETRPRIKKENPELQFHQVAVKVGERWQSLSDEEKIPYRQRAEEDKARYKKEKERFIKATMELNQSTNAKGRKGAVPLGGGKKRKAGSAAEGAPPIKGGRGASQSQVNAEAGVPVPFTIQQQQMQQMQHMHQMHQMQQQMQQHIQQQQMAMAQQMQMAQVHAGSAGLHPHMAHLQQQARHMMAQQPQHMIPQHMLQPQMMHQGSGNNTTPNGSNPMEFASFNKHGNYE